jgi:hypothetical protein
MPYTDYTPIGPWADATLVTRNSDGTLFEYDAGINALILKPNLLGAKSKDAGNSSVSTIINLPSPVNSGDAVNKSYADSIIGAGGGIPEAPNDGKTYSRLNSSWTSLVDGGTY